MLIENKKQKYIELHWLSINLICGKLTCIDWKGSVSHVIVWLKSGQRWNKVNWYLMILLISEPLILDDRNKTSHVSNETI